MSRASSLMPKALQADASPPAEGDSADPGATMTRRIAEAITAAIVERRLMPGTNPDALETWALDENTFEYLMSRLADYGRVVLLSGDVHNAASNLMSYWRGTSTTPARIAQFTSSGFKNVMPVYLQALDAKAMLLQQMLLLFLKNLFCLNSSYTPYTA